LAQHLEGGFGLHHLEIHLWFQKVLLALLRTGCDLLSIEVVLLGPVERVFRRQDTTSPQRVLLPPDRDLPKIPLLRVELIEDLVLGRSVFA